ncbi:hypothetical protein NE865_15765 [Phthorimaea operculella]|nr:hypothetical protein NE865_15765 [Phthorimaea operculella]
MIFSGRSVDLPQSIIARSPMPVCDRCKFLGFTLDSHLSWEHHVEALCGRLSSAVYALRQLKPLITPSALKQAYFAYFHSLMAYGSLLWGAASNADQVLIMQKRAIRVIAGVKPLHSCRQLFPELQIMTHYGQYIFDVINQVRRNLSEFKRVSAGSRTIRRTGRLAPVKHRIALARRNPRVIGPSLYDKLPMDFWAGFWGVFLSRRSD